MFDQRMTDTLFSVVFSLYFLLDCGRYKVPHEDPTFPPQSEELTGVSQLGK